MYGRAKPRASVCTALGLRVFGITNRPPFRPVPPDIHSAFFQGGAGSPGAVSASGETGNGIFSLELVRITGESRMSEDFFPPDKGLFPGSLSGLEGKTRRYDGKKTVQTVRIGCEYRFLVYPAFSPLQGGRISSLQH